jgi:hypothetical protein
MRIAVENEIPVEVLKNYRSAKTEERVSVRTQVLKFGARAYAQMEEAFTRYWLARGVDWEGRVAAHG